MLTSFFVVLAAALLAAALLGWAAYSQRFGWAALGATVGIALVLGITCLFWQQAVLIAAISSVVFLGLGVMLQKVAPAKAVLGALTGLLLLFAFVWLARQMASVFLFDRAPQLPFWVESIQITGLDNFAPADFLTDGDWAWHDVVFVLGMLITIGSAYITNRSRVIVSIVGALLLIVTAPNVFAAHLPSLFENPAFQDPFVRLGLLVLGGSLLIRLIIASTGKAKQP